jgi:hypothetical protein
LQSPAVPGWPMNAPRRALVSGWFSFLNGEATAGDLLAADTAVRWLTDAGIAHDVALSPVLRAGAAPDEPMLRAASAPDEPMLRAASAPDEPMLRAASASDELMLRSGVVLDEIDPRRYSHLLFVCGPAAGWQVEDLLRRFGHCTKIAVGVSIVASTPAGFDVVLSRDGPGGDRPDLSLVAARSPLPPVVAVVRAHRQNEYPDAQHDRVHRVVDEVLRASDIAVVELDTRVDPRTVVGRRPRDVEATLARVDAVVTTRMHGLVLALRHGVPAVAVDAVPRGAKVRQQAAVLGWPAVLTADDLTADRLFSWLCWALGGEAAVLARRCADTAAPQLHAVQQDMLAALTR